MSLLFAVGIIGAWVARAEPPARLAALSSPILLRGDDNTGYRDPLLIEHEGLFQMFFTLGKKEPDGRVYLHVAKSTSTDLAHWTPPRILTPRDMKSWRAAGQPITLGQKDWPWAQGRITAGYVADLGKLPGIGKYVMVFHGTGPEPEPIKFLTGGSIGIARSDDLVQWDWPGKKVGSCIRGP